MGECAKNHKTCEVKPCSHSKLLNSLIKHCTPSSPHEKATGRGSIYFARDCISIGTSSSQYLNVSSQRIETGPTAPPTSLGSAHNRSRDHPFLHPKTLSKKLTDMLLSARDYSPCWRWLHIPVLATAPIPSVCSKLRPSTTCHETEG